MVFVSNRPEGEPTIETVNPGIHVLSNASLDSPWPKVAKLIYLCSISVQIRTSIFLWIMLLSTGNSQNGLCIFQLFSFYNFFWQEWGHGTMHTADWSLLWINVFIFKVQTVDPNRSTWSSYENVLVDQILHSLDFFYYFLRLVENHLI